MFVRKKKNRSGSVSIQIISKRDGKYKVRETIDCSKDKYETERLSGSPKESHFKALTEPYVIVSHHTALIAKIIDIQVASVEIDLALL